jgi:hypothetical protein
MLLHDVPVHAVGISWEQWMEQQRERIFAEARRRRNKLRDQNAPAETQRCSEADTEAAPRLFPLNGSYGE